MNKEQQIEEMANFISDYNYTDPTFLSASDVAEMIYDADYRKITGNEVVIHKNGENRTTEEIEWLVEHNKEVRKQAIKELFKEIFDLYMTDDGCFYVQDIQELAEKNEVEL